MVPSGERLADIIENKLTSNSSINFVGKIVSNFRSGTVLEATNFYMASKDSQKTAEEYQKELDGLVDLTPNHRNYFYGSLEKRFILGEMGFDELIGTCLSRTSYSFEEVAPGVFEKAGIDSRSREDTSLTKYSRQVNLKYYPVRDLAEYALAYRRRIAELEEDKKTIVDVNLEMLSYVLEAKWVRYLREQVGKTGGIDNYLNSVEKGKVYKFDRHEMSVSQRIMYRLSDGVISGKISIDDRTRIRQDFCKAGYDWYI